MVTKPTKHCDVFDDTVKGVEGYRVVIYKGDAKTFVKDADLCPRALKRLERMITKGLEPPRRSSKDAGSEKEQ